MQRGRARVESQGVLGAQVAAYLLFEPLAARTSRQPPAAQRLDNFGYVVVLDRGPMKGQPIGSYRLAAIQREPLGDHRVAREIERLMAL